MVVGEGDSIYGHTMNESATLERAGLGLHSAVMGEPLKFLEWWNDSVHVRKSM